MIELLLSALLQLALLSDTTSDQATLHAQNPTTTATIPAETPNSKTITNSGGSGTWDDKN